MLKKDCTKKNSSKITFNFSITFDFNSMLINIFYDRHWDKIITRFVNIASNQVGLLMSDYNLNGLISTQKNAVKLNLKFLTFRNSNLKKNQIIF